MGLILAIVGAAPGGNLQNDDYHPGAGGAHKALGILAVVAIAIQVSRQLILLFLQNQHAKSACISCLHNS